MPGFKRVSEVAKEKGVSRNDTQGKKIITDFAGKRTRLCRSKGVAMTANVLAVGVRCRLWNTKDEFKTNFYEKWQNSKTDENGNDANRLLATVPILTKRR